MTLTAPRDKTKKRLFAVSGNKCYFPNCNTPLVDLESGTVTGEICHIKGKKPDSLRYDPDQSDEERHGFDNLILMCGLHHKVIDDDPESYNVPRLEDIKKSHEQSNIGGKELSDILINLFINNVTDGSIIFTQDQKGGQVAHSIFNIGYGEQASSSQDHIRLKNKLQNVFNNIRDDLEKIRIKDHSLVEQGKTDYHFILKKSWDHKESDKANLKLFQDGFYDYIRSIKDDWKYFGINANRNITFCFKKYGFFNYLIRTSSHLAIPDTELLNKILSDMKEICKNRYQIELE